MKIAVNPAAEEWEALLRRPVLDLRKIEKIVLPIMEKVKRNGDKALIRFASEYDHAQISEVLVSKEEMAAAADKVDPLLKASIEIAHKNIHAFHAAQQQEELVMETMPGVICRRRSVPIQRVGLYVPGGTAPLFSTVLMLGVPAKIAGCKEIVLCTPCNSKGEVNPVILYTAKLIGIERVVKAGGAQAIAAMSYGTESVPAVYKIFGPGNQYVTAAKLVAAREGMAIDMPAGPSEVAVYADETAVPDFVAADLLSQAEHGVDSQVILVASSQQVVDDVMAAQEKQLAKLPRKDIAERALENSTAIVMQKEKAAIALLNEYAAEHLILSVKDPHRIANRIVNAGSIFLGNFTPESAGDYASGTNHTLPTNGSARAFSGVSLDSFVKKITLQEITPAGMKKIGPAIEQMAEAEELIAHKRAVSLRLNYIEDQDV